MNQKIEIRNLCIATGWYADSKQKPNRDLRCVDKNWFVNFWLPAIIRQIPLKYFYLHFYISECEIMPVIPANLRTVISRGLLPQKEILHQHDFHASMLTAAVHAYCNRANLLFVEQDCLVYGLKDILKLAYHKNIDIGYGFGDSASYKTGWAAQSLVFVGYKFLSEFIDRLKKSDIIDTMQYGNKFRLPEEVFHLLFNDRFYPWPFGVDRLRPVPWDAKVFYFQQPSTGELEQYVRLFQ